MITLSPGFSPWVTTQYCPCVRAAVTRRLTTLLFAPRIITLALPLASRDRAGSGTRKARSLIACAKRARTNMPGSSSPCALGKRARIVTVPVS